MRTHAKQPTQIDTASFVRAILERNRRPNAQLEDLVIHYNCYDSIGRLDPSDELVRWTATLELSSDDEEGGTAEPAVVATATYFAFDILDSRWDPNDVLDAHSADMAVYSNLFDSEGNLLDELTFGGSCSRLVIMDRVSVDRDWRGQRFGPFLASRALRHLSDDDAIAACYRLRSSSRSTIPTATENELASVASGSTWASGTTVMASSSAIQLLANSTVR